MKQIQELLLPPLFLNLIALLSVEIEVLLIFISGWVNKQYFVLTLDKRKFDALLNPMLICDE